MLVCSYYCDICNKEIAKSEVFGDVSTLFIDTGKNVHHVCSDCL